MSAIASAQQHTSTAVTSASVRQVHQDKHLFPKTNKEATIFVTSHLILRKFIHYLHFKWKQAFFSHYIGGDHWLTAKLPHLRRIAGDGSSNIYSGVGRDAGGGGGGGYHEMQPLSAAAGQLPSVRARLYSLNSLNSRVPRFGPQYYINLYQLTHFGSQVMEVFSIVLLLRILCIHHSIGIKIEDL